MWQPATTITASTATAKNVAAAMRCHREGTTGGWRLYEQRHFIESGKMFKVTPNMILFSLQCNPLCNFAHLTLWVAPVVMLLCSLGRLLGSVGLPLQWQMLLLLRLKIHASVSLWGTYRLTNLLWYLNDVFQFISNEKCCLLVYKRCVKIDLNYFIIITDFCIKMLVR